MPSHAPKADDVAALTYEQARAGLVSVIQTLEAGAETLDQSLALWERGEALAARCQDLLDGARARLDAVRPTDDAAPNPSEEA
ncbi:MAG: exodeoxyribonuclease VII small subunit [Bifidobacteriaceae bacterium]|jgi:exodeoxyribonuclease VII small subunit|nr:exodeoxyribonuclease VII small subunit [Bifidobacteriaceae bacterium]